MLIAQRPHTPRFHEKRRFRQRLPNPSDREGAQDMPVPHDHDVALPLCLGERLADDRGVVFLSDLSD